MTNTNLLYLTKYCTVDLNKLKTGEIYPSKAALCEQLGINYQNAAHMRILKKYVAIEKTGKGCEVKIASIKEGTTKPPERKQISKPYKNFVVPKEVQEKPFHYIKRGDHYPNMTTLLAKLGFKDTPFNRSLVKRHITYTQDGHKMQITSVYDKDRLLDGFNENSNSFIFYKELMRFLGRGDNLKQAYTLEEIRDNCFNPDHIFKTNAWKKYEKEHPDEVSILKKLQDEIKTYSYHYVYETLYYLRDRKKLNWMEELYGIESNGKSVLLPTGVVKHIRCFNQELLKKHKINTYQRGYHFSKEYQEYTTEFLTFLQKKYGVSKLERKKLFIFETTSHLPRIPEFNIDSWIQDMVLTKFKENPVVKRIFI